MLAEVTVPSPARLHDYVPSTRENTVPRFLANLPLATLAAATLALLPAVPAAAGQVVDPGADQLHRPRAAVRAAPAALAGTALFLPWALYWGLLIP